MLDRLGSNTMTRFKGSSRTLRKK